MIVHIEFLVEELSTEAALRNLIPKIVGDDLTYDIHPFNGKNDLLSKLPIRLQGYRSWLPKDWRLIVLIDEDRENCFTLKERLNEMAEQAGFITKSRAKERSEYQVMNRLIIEELEAWFFGDLEALMKVYPNMPKTLDEKEKYREPDGILGGTWEALERELKKAGYYPGGIPKVESARKISIHMDPQRNKSKSFQVFRDGLYELIQLQTS